MNYLAVAVLLLAGALPVAAQIKTLVPVSRVPVSASLSGYRNFLLPTACDEQGRIYVKLTEFGTPTVGPIRRLSSSGVLEASFDTTGALPYIYAVRPGGGVAMVRSDGTNKHIDNFGPDGQLESTVELERPPAPFFPRQIAVFRSGEILVSGPPYRSGYAPSTAVYDRTGHLVKQFTLPGDLEMERAAEAGDTSNSHAVSRSEAVTADDGYVYLLRASSPATVYTISADGTVVHQFVLTNPSPIGTANALRVVDHKLLVNFHGSCGDPKRISSCRGSFYSVVDANTGQKLADYEAGDLSGPIACYTPKSDRLFIFYTPLDKQLVEIVEAQPK